MIVVTGATGQLGRLVVENLLDRVSATQIGVSVRDPAKAADLAARGIRVRKGDFATPEGLPFAFEGASQLLLVSSNGRVRGEDTIAQHGAAIAAAKQAGVQRILYTSHMAASSISAFPPMQDHAATEEMLRQSGLGWTALRNGFYAASAVTFLGDAPKGGGLKVPKDGKVCWTTHEDLAEAAAVLLTTQANGFDGPTPPLTAPDALDLKEVATLAAQLLGRPIRHDNLSDDDFKAALAARGLPPHLMGTVMGFYLASRNGEFAATDPTLETLIGRKPRGMKEVLAAGLTNQL